MNRWLLWLCLLALSLAMTACQLNSGSPAAPLPPLPPSSAGLPLAVGPTSQPEGGLDPIVSSILFQVFCDILVADVPAGSLSGGVELWKLLREDGLGVKRADHLARNGLRVGVGRPADFNQVTRLLTAARDGRVRTGRMRFETDSPMEMTLDGTLRERRAFAFAADGTVSGEEFPASATFYWVSAWHDIEHLDTVNLSLVPEIRYGRTKEKFYNPTVGRVDAYRDVGRVFQEVKLELRQNRGEFMVIAPQPKGGALAIGRAVLGDDSNKAQPRELLVLIRPRVVRVPGR